MSRKRARTPDSHYEQFGELARETDAILDELEAEGREPRGLVGYSLSFCIGDILDGKVREEDVFLIITGTAARTDADLEQVLSHYEEHYWKAHGRGVELARRLWRAGKIIQPRLRGEEPRSLVDRRWWSTPGEGQLR